MFTFIPVRCQKTQIVEVMMRNYDLSIYEMLRIRMKKPRLDTQLDLIRAEVFV